MADNNDNSCTTGEGSKTTNYNTILPTADNKSIWLHIEPNSVVGGQAFPKNDDILNQTDRQATVITDADPEFTSSNIVEQKEDNIATGNTNDDTDIVVESDNEYISEIFEWKTDKEPNEQDSLPTDGTAPFPAIDVAQATDTITNTIDDVPQGDIIIPAPDVVPQNDPAAIPNISNYNDIENTDDAEELSEDEIYSEEDTFIMDFYSARSCDELQQAVRRSQKLPPKWKNPVFPPPIPVLGDRDIKLARELIGVIDHSCRVRLQYDPVDSTRIFNAHPTKAQASAHRTEGAPVWYRMFPERVTLS